jgi:hypothetical protein
MKYRPIKNFKVLMYDSYTFQPSYVEFDMINYYTIDNENDRYISINKAIFYKNKTEDKKYFNDYFYSIKEERNFKLRKIYDIYGKKEV